MPLIHSKSKKAMSRNIETEMHHGKPQKQAIAIAYDIKRKAGKKKMADGGMINAKNEKRPMPSDLHDDRIMADQNKHMRSNGEDGWTDKPTEHQAMANDVRGKKLPIKRPRMVPSDAFSTRIYDEEGQLQESAKPGPYGEQPPRHDDEEDAKKMGKSPDMADEHSTRRKPYAKGGEVESRDYEHPANKYEDSHLSHLNPSEDEGEMYADEHDEEGQDRQGPDNIDMEHEHSNGRKPYARGGEVSPDEEMEEEHHNSIAAAIMARRREMHDMIDSGSMDLDEAVRMAEGGEILEKSGKILSHGSMDSDDSDQADLSRNHDEDANEEDQASYNALRKENYNDSNLDAVNHMDSGEHGDSEEMDSENKHSMISEIRRKMKSRKQF